MKYCECCKCDFDDSFTYCPKCARRLVTEEVKNRILKEQREAQEKAEREARQKAEILADFKEKYPAFIEVIKKSETLRKMFDIPEYFAEGRLGNDLEYIYRCLANSYDVTPSSYERFLTRYDILVAHKEHTNQTMFNELVDIANELREIYDKFHEIEEKYSDIKYGLYRPSEFYYAYLHGWSFTQLTRTEKANERFANKDYYAIERDIIGVFTTIKIREGLKTRLDNLVRYNRNSEEGIYYYLMKKEIEDLINQAKELLKYAEKYDLEKRKFNPSKYDLGYYKDHMRIKPLEIDKYPALTPYLSVQGEEKKKIGSYESQF